MPLPAMCPVQLRSSKRRRLGLLQRSARFSSFTFGGVNLSGQAFMRRLLRFHLKELRHIAELLIPALQQIMNRHLLYLGKILLQRSIK